MTAYRSGELACPACGKGLTAIEAVGRRLHRCPDCHGAWVEESVLAGMFDAMRQAPGPPAPLPFGLNLPEGAPRQPEGAPRQCPACRELLDQISLASVPVDRCEHGHGVWFDRTELQQALHRNVAIQAKLAEQAAPPGSLLRFGVWWNDLLRGILDYL